MNWYQVIKKASGATITETPVKNILDLSRLLRLPVVEVIQSILPPKEFEKWENTRSPEFITSDNAEQQKGFIHFYTAGLSGLALRKAIGFIGLYAKELGVDVGQPIFKEGAVHFPVNIHSSNANQWNNHEKMGL